MSMVKLLTAENQKNENIYEIIIELFTILKNEDWIKNYILWELDLLKFVGYDLQLKKITNKEKNNNKTQYFVQTSNNKKFVPSFFNKKIQSFVKRKVFLSFVKEKGSIDNKWFNSFINYSNNLLL